MSPRADPEPHGTHSEPPPSPFRPLIFGEALFDCFAGGERVLGGAPFNVAWHLKGFKAHPLLVSRLGKDAMGEEILERMEQWGMDRRGIQLDHHRPTGRVNAEVEGGEPTFTIPPGQAYDEIRQDLLPPLEGLAGSDLLYYGTLALREDVSRGTLGWLRATLPCPVLVDVNLREPWWTRVVVEWAIRGAGCVKLSREEVGRLARLPVDTRENLMEATMALARRYGIGLVVVTLGQEGAVAVREGEFLWQDAPPVPDLKDSVGAGDAFSAVLALGLHHHWPLALTLRRAVEFAAELCRRRGATQDDPGLYTFFQSRWNHDA